MPGLFEGDQDIDAALGLIEELGFETESWKFDVHSIIFQTDRLAPFHIREAYKTSEYVDHLANTIVPYVRRKLDTSNLGESLFAASRAKEKDTPFQESRYRTIILGALMLRAAARIKEEDRQHLRDLIPHINCRSRRMILGDEGSRTPGLAQFRAALHRYQPGVASNYQEPNCFTCGKLESELVHKLLTCKKCKAAWYCGRECQREQWP